MLQNSRRLRHSVSFWCEDSFSIRRSASRPVEELLHPSAGLDISKWNNSIVVADLLKKYFFNSFSALNNKSPTSRQQSKTSITVRKLVPIWSSWLLHVTSPLNLTRAAAIGSLINRYRLVTVLARQKSWTWFFFYSCLRLHNWKSLDKRHEDWRAETGVFVSLLLVKVAVDHWLIVIAQGDVSK